MTDPDAPITQLLKQWKSGDDEALSRLLPLVYEDLLAVAARRMHSESEGHTLQATALVSEAYVRLAGARIDWEDRTHFFAIAASTMRRILVDHARARTRDKRGGDQIRVTLPPGLAANVGRDEDLLELDRAMKRLAEFDTRKSRIVEMVFFGGLSQPEVANVLELSLATVERDLRAAKAWLSAQLLE